MKTGVCAKIRHLSYGIVVNGHMRVRIKQKNLNYDKFHKLIS